MAEAYFDAGMTEKSEELFRSARDADPGWGWGSIAGPSATCRGRRPADLAGAE